MQNSPLIPKWQWGAGLDTIYLLSHSQLFVTLAWNFVLAGKAQGQLGKLKLYRRQQTAPVV